MPTCDETLSFPSLLCIFSKIRDEGRTQPGLTRVDTLSSSSQEIGISEIQSLVNGLSVPSLPLRMKGFLSYSDREWPLRLIPSVRSLSWAEQFAG